jgi:hypothetical protein
VPPLHFSVALLFVRQRWSKRSSSSSQGHHSSSLASVLVILPVSVACWVAPPSFRVLALMLDTSEKSSLGCSLGGRPRTTPSALYCALSSCSSISSPALGEALEFEQPLPPLQFFGEQPGDSLSIGCLQPSKNYIQFFVLSYDRLLFYLCASAGRSAQARAPRATTLVPWRVSWRFFQYRLHAG